jgi:hypothetical protein
MGHGIAMKKLNVKTAPVTRRELITGRAATSLAEAASARIMTAAQTAHDRANGEARELALVSTSKGLRALVRHGRTVIEIENEDFAVRTLSERTE